MAIAAKPVSADSASVDRLVHFEVAELFGQYTYRIPDQGRETRYGNYRSERKR